MEIGVSWGLTARQSQAIALSEDTWMISYDWTTISWTAWNIIIWAWTWKIRNYDTWIVTTVTWEQQEITASNIATKTNWYVYIDSAWVAQQLNEPLNDIQMRDWIFLTRWTSLDNVSVVVVEDKPVWLIWTDQTLRELLDLIGFIKTWITFSWNAGGLQMARTAWKLFQAWVNISSNAKQPNKSNIDALGVVNVMRKATQDWPVDVAPVSVIDTANYDLNGVVTAMQPNKFANIRIIQFPTWNVGLYYGQIVYNSQAAALAWIDNDSFVRWPTEREGMWVATVTHRTWATDFEITNDLIVTIRDDFSISTSWIAGISSTTLQQAYNNSSTPEITTSNWPMTLKNGWANNDIAVSEIQNLAGTLVYQMLANWKQLIWPANDTDTWTGTWQWQHKIQTDGLIKQGEWWDDLVAKFSAATPWGAAPTVADIWNGHKLRRFAEGDSMFIEYHVNHNYAPTTVAFPHIHWFPTTTMTAWETVVWEFIYTLAKWHQQGDVINGTRTTITITHTADGTELAGEHMVTECADIDAFNLIEPDVQVLAEVKRTTGTYASNIFWIQADLHFQTDRIATVEKAPDFYVETP